MTREASRTRARPKRQRRDTRPDPVEVPGVELPEAGATTSWNAIFSILSRAPGLDDEDRVLLAIVLLERLAEPQRALKLLSEASPTTVADGDWSLVEWLRFQAAYACGESGPDNAPIGPLLRHLHDGKSLGRIPLDALDPLQPGELKTLMLLLLLGARAAWPRLYESLCDGNAADRSLAAHIAGDRLDDRARQLELMHSLGEDMPTLAAEVQLELALAQGDSGEAVVTALRNRAEALRQTLEPNAPDRQVSATLLQLFDDSDDGPGSLAPPAASTAWQRLTLLIERRRLVRDPAALAQVYQRHAERCDQPLAAALRLRAAQLLLASGNAAQAVTALEGATTSGAMQKAVRRTRLLCLAVGGDIAAIADQLLDLGADLSPEEAAHVMHIAVAISWNDDTALARIRSQLGQLLESSERSRARQAAGLLLASHRRLDDAAARAATWERLMEVASDNGSRACCGFAAFVAGIDRDDGDGKQQRGLLAAQRMYGKRASVCAALALTRDNKSSWGLLIDHLERIASQLEQEEAHQLLRDAARLALSAARAPSRALSLLERALEQRADDVTTLKEYAAIHLHLGHARQVVDVLERAARATDDESDAAELLCSVGDIHQRKLRDETAAEGAYRRVLELNPLHVSALQALRTMMVDRSPDELIPVLQSLLTLSHERSEQLQLELQLARAHRARWQQGKQEADLDASVEHCRRALDLDASDEAAATELVSSCLEADKAELLIGQQELLSKSIAGLRGLLQAFESRSMWRELIAAQEQLIARATSDADRYQTALRAGEIALEKLQDQSIAKRLLREACNADKTSARAFELLGQIYEGEQRYQELAQLLEQRLEAETAQGRTPARRLADLHLQSGRLWFEKLGNVETGREHFEQALKLDPTDQQALRLLDRAFAHENRQADRARVLERLLEQVEAEPLAFEVLLELGAVYEAMQDERSLLRIAQRLGSAFAEHADAFAFTERVLHKLGRVTDLADLYERRVQILENQTSAPDEMARLLRSKAEVELRQLRSPAAAADTLIRLLELHPEDKQTVRQVEEILSATNDWHRLMTVYERQANRVDDPKQRAAYLHQAAHIAHNELQDEAAAGRLYERIYALDPADSVSFAAIERRLERQDDYKRLVTLLVDHAKRVPTKQERLECILRAAAICEKIPDVEQALQLYSYAAKIDPDSIFALDSQARIYEALERWQDFLRVMERQITLEKHSHRRALMFFKCGSVMETQFQDDDEAFRYYMLAIKSSSKCLPALHGLRDLHSRRGDWEQVAETLQIEARIWTDPKGKADMLARIAEIYAKRLGDRSKALEYYKRATDTYAGCIPAALALFEHNADRGSLSEAAKWGKLCASKGRLRGLSPEETAQFYVRWARVLQRLGQASEAADALMHALERGDKPVDALGVLLDLCRNAPNTFDFASALSKLGRQNKIQSDPLAMALVSAAAGALAEQRGDLDGALSLYRHAHSLASATMRVVEPLADLLLLVEGQEHAIELVRRCQQTERSLENWAGATEWLAYNEMARRGRPQAAVVLYCDVLERLPERHEVRVQLARALLLVGDAPRAYRQMARACEAAALRDVEPALLARYHHLLGVAAERAGKPPAAETNWRRAIEMAPSWIYPHLRLALGFYRAGKQEAAERELKLAEQGMEQPNPDVLRAQAEYYAARGFSDRAITLYYKTVRLHDPDVDDRLRLALLLAERGDQEQALSTVRAVIDDRTSYAPAYRALSKLCAAAGDAEQTRRAAQVWETATGIGQDEATPPVSDRPIDGAGWQRFVEPLVEEPLHHLLQLLRELVDAPGPTDAQPEQRANVVLALEHLAARLQLKATASIAPQQSVPLTVRKNELLLSQEAHDLPLAQMQPLLLTGLAAIKLGYQLLFNVGSGRLRELAAAMSTLVDPKRQAEIARRLTRRQQRQLVQLVERFGLSPADVARRFDPWVVLMHEKCKRAALLLSQDFVSCSRVVALEQGIEGRITLQGGLLTALPEVQAQARYYLGAEFVADRAALLP